MSENNIIAGWRVGDFYETNLKQKVQIIAIHPITHILEIQNCSGEIFFYNLQGDPFNAEDQFNNVECTFGKLMRRLSGSIQHEK